MTSLRNPPEPEGIAAALAALPMPLTSIEPELTVAARDLEHAAAPALGPTPTRSLSADHPGLVHFSLVDLGGLVIACGKCTPLQQQEEDGGFSRVVINYAGAFFIRDQTTVRRNVADQALIFPRDGGQLSCDHAAWISFRLEQTQLLRTIAVIGGGELAATLRRPFVLGAAAEDGSINSARALFSLFGYIDALLAEDRYLPSLLQFDDQIQRLIAVATCREAGVIDAVSRRSAATPAWSSILDDLVDYIRANHQNHLTLTDLEEQSNYSGRQLQNLFRRKFGLSPMQFIRRQRLSGAMQRLRDGDPTATVTRIARDCGYRHVSNFSLDFQQEFGLRPSEVLRQARIMRARRGQAESP